MAGGVGGEAAGVEIGSDELFARLAGWDDAHYILAACTKAGSDEHDTDGILDGHVYTVLHVRKITGRRIEAYSLVLTCRLPDWLRMVHNAAGRARCVRHAGCGPN